MPTLPLSPAYRTPVKVAIVLQVVATLLLLAVLDGGTLAKVGGVAMAGFWIGAGAVMLRRPRNPSSLDLLYIRCGYPALLLACIACMPFMTALRGRPNLTAHFSARTRRVSLRRTPGDVWLCE